MTSRAICAPLLYQLRVADKGPLKACFKSPPYTNPSKSDRSVKAQRICLWHQFECSISLSLKLVDTGCQGVKALQCLKTPKLFATIWAWKLSQLDTVATSLQQVW